MNIALPLDRSRTQSMTGRLLAGLGLMLALFVLSSCTSTAPGGPAPLASPGPSNASLENGGLQIVAELPPPDTRNGGEQPIAPDDLLSIDVFQVDSLDRTVQVDSQGNISLPLIGSIRAGGSTVRQLEQTIETAYGGRYLQSPDVTVFVKESRGQRITVDGEVTRAGIYPVSSNSTLLDLVAQASGLRPIADPKKVYVYRDYAGRKLVANYDLDAIRKGQNPNPRVYGGDLVVVFTSGSKVAMSNLREMLGLAAGVSRVAVIP